MSFQPAKLVQVEHKNKNYFGFVETQPNFAKGKDIKLRLISPHFIIENY